jgi:hypothetical protein
LVFVYDGGRSVKVFRSDGEAIEVEGSTLPLSGLGTTRLRSLAVAREGVLVAIEGRGREPSSRSLQTWLLAAGELRLVHQLALPVLPRAGTGSFVPPQQARAVWSAVNDCIVVGDGSSPWLLRLRLSSGRADTIVLPSYTVPRDERTAERMARMRRLLDRAAADLDISLPVGDATPTAIWRWAEVAIDPDGHIWVNPWRLVEQRQQPLEILRIAPNGRITNERVPAFPIAFGPPGSFYARQKHPTTDELLIVRYDLRR